MDGLEEIIVCVRYKNRSWPSQTSIIKNLEFFLFVSYFLIFFQSLLFFGHFFMLYTMMFVPFSLYTCKLGYGNFPLSHLTSP